MHRYETGKSRDTGQSFRETHPEVATVRTMFHEWLRTVYSTYFHSLWRPFTDCFNSGDEEKKRRSLQGAVSLLSMASPPLVDVNATGTKDGVSLLHLADTNIPTTPMDTGGNPPPHPADTDGPITTAMEVGDDSPPYLADTNGTTTAAMDTEDDASLPHLANTDNPTDAAVGAKDDTFPLHVSTSSANLSTSPTGADNQQSLNLPASSLPGTGTTDPLPVDTAFRNMSETPLRLPSPFLDGSSSGPPSAPLPAANSLHTTSPCSATPAKTPLAQPSLASAGNNAFDLTGVCGDFISKSTREYWESVPGGEKWVAMVKSYLVLQTMPSSNRVSTLLHYILSNELTTISSNFCDSLQRLDQMSYKPGLNLGSVPSTGSPSLRMPATTELDG